MEVGMATKKRDKERGAKLQAHRKRLGLTQRQVADRIGTVTDVVSRHENGGGMESDTLLAYSQLYGVTPESIMGEGAPIPQPAVSASGATDAQHVALQRFLNDGRCNPLTDREMRYVLRHLAGGESEELDDLEVHLLGYRFSSNPTDENLSKLRAAVKRSWKASGQATLEPSALPSGKRKKLVRRAELIP